MYAVIAVFCAGVVYAVFTRSPYISLICALTGTKILHELYKIDMLENPWNYEKRKRK